MTTTIRYIDVIPLPSSPEPLVAERTVKPLIRVPRQPPDVKPLTRRP